MNVDAFNEFAARIRQTGMAGAEIVVGMAAVAAGFTVTRGDGGELKAVPA